jgi:hypothetical protein
MAKQHELAGFEAPRNADIEASLDLWLEARDEQKYAVDKTKLRHAALLLHMANAGIDAYPFVDQRTGKKRQVVIARDPKAKTLSAPRPNRRDDDAEIAEEITDERVLSVVDEPAVDNVVEMRRVKRESIEDEIDPFAIVRSALEEAVTADLVANGHVASHTNGVKPKRKAKGKKAT